jgi:hypothetical protein
MRPERAQLPSREQIEGIRAIGALETLLQDVVEDRLKIETDLEFRPGDEDWEHRARSALKAHRITEHNIRRQISRLNPKGKDQEPSPEKALARAQSRTAHELAAQAAAARKVAAAEAMRTTAVRSLRVAVERANIATHFVQAALETLPPEDYARLHAEALRRQEAALEHMIKEASR